MRKAMSIKLQKANLHRTPERFDSKLRHCIIPGRDPRLDQDPAFAPAKISKYDAATRRNWSSRFTSPPPPIPNFATIEEFDNYVNTP
jgi:hypothetical protein